MKYPHSPVATRSPECPVVYKTETLTSPPGDENLISGTEHDMTLNKYTESTQIIHTNNPRLLRSL